MHGSSAPRFAKRPHLKAIKKADIESSLISKIDAISKGLRSCTRQLTPLEQCLDDETRILERVYYRGVNQHRTAVFWRKVEEIRRFGRRILEVQLLELVTELRYSFHTDEDSERHAWMLKTAWSQIPDGGYVKFVFERAQASLELLTKAHDRIIGAHRSFILMLRTGAFPQVMMTLTAIVSRMGALVTELKTTVEQLLDVTLALLGILGYDIKKSRTKYGIHVQKEPTRQAVTSLQVIDDTPIDNVFDEDLGSIVIRQSTRTETTTAEKQAAPTSMFLQQGYPMVTPNTTGVEFSEASLAVTKTSEHAPSPSILSRNPEPHSRNATTTDKKTKKKRKKDEIDAIFASL